MELNKTLQQGITALKEGKFQEAERLYQEILQTQPTHPHANHNLGITLYTLGRLKEAETSFKKAIEFKPDYIDAYYNLGLTLQKLHKLEEAETSYKKAIALNPGYVIAHNNLGNTLKDLGKLNEAEASYKKAIALKPDNRTALLNRGQILFEKGEFELSLKDFDACNNTDSRSRSLISLYALGRVEEIYQRIETHSELDDENIRVAAFSSFVANKEKKDTAHNFCRKPMDFINFSNLSSHLKNPSSFITEVIEELHNVKTIWEPLGTTTYKGLQSISNLFENPLGKLSNLKSIIKDELDLYYLKFKNESCSYIKKWPSKKNLFAWHVILKNQGYQDAHIHSGGWLSGVIYLKLAPALEKNEGAIEFGLNGAFYSDVKSPKVIYQPKLGDIILFPSSLHHKTIPFSTDTDRISIAFDLLPKRVKL